MISTPFDVRDSWADGDRAGLWMHGDLHFLPFLEAEDLDDLHRQRHGEGTTGLDDRSFHATILPNTYQISIIADGWLVVNIITWYKRVFVRPSRALFSEYLHVIPDLSVLWVIFFVLLITTLLNLLLFKPLLAVKGKREGAVKSARALAESAAAKAQQAADEFESRTKAARAEVYEQMDATRRAAEERRAQLLAAAREQAAASTADAAAQMAAETAEARVRIERDADALAGAIAERVLGRQTT